ncbi:hypothetical protein BDR04DRAFT_1143286 [Suillus decipiens]|nr:hypothetical protein BDR04DRAFT_1143286 [Suillus decipiens]
MAEDTALIIERFEIIALATPSDAQVQVDAKRYCHSLNLAGFRGAQCPSPLPSAASDVDIAPAKTPGRLQTCHICLLSTPWSSGNMYKVPSQWTKIGHKIISQAPNAVSKTSSSTSSERLFYMNGFNAPNPQSPRPARDNRSAAQRRYRKKEEDGFLQLREVLKEVAKDDPRTRQDILKRASCELRRLADENYLLSQQKALIEARHSPRESYRDEHSQSPSCGSIYEDPWSHDGTMAEVTWADMARHRVFDAATNATMPTAQDYEWFTQLYDATMAQDSQFKHQWASHQSGDFTTRPHNGSGYHASLCANCQHGQ